MKKVLFNWWVASLSVFFASGAALWSYKMPSPQQERERVVIADTSMITSALIYIALAQGYFAEQGLDVQLQSHAYGKLALSAALDGKADLATVAEVPFANAIIAGRNPVIIAGISTSDKDVMLISRRDVGLRSPRDLIGKTIGIIAGTNSETFLRLFLSTNNISTTDVHMLATKPDEAIELLSSGKIDAFSGWLSLRLKAEQVLKQRYFVLTEPSAYTENWLLTAPSTFLIQRPNTTQKLLRALIKAEDYARTEPVASQAITQRYININPEALIRYWSDFGFVVDLNQAMIINLEYMARVALENKVGERLPNFLNAIAFDEMAQVDSARVIIPH